MVGYRKGLIDRIVENATSPGSEKDNGIGRIFFCLSAGYLASAVVLGALTLLVNPNYRVRMSGEGGSREPATTMIAADLKTRDAIGLRSGNRGPSPAAASGEEEDRPDRGKPKDLDAYLLDNWFDILPAVFAGSGAVSVVAIYWSLQWLDQDAPSGYVLCFYRRAARYEKKSNIILGLIFLLIIGGSIVFFKAASFASDDVVTLGTLTAKLNDGNAATSGSHAIVGKDGGLDSAGDEGSARRSATATDANQEKNRDDAKNRTPGNSIPPAWLPLAFVLTLRVGDIAITSFLTIMCLRIYRYNLRLASFYMSRGDALRFKKDDGFEAVDAELLPVLLDANFDFGTDVDPLSKHFADIISALNPRKSGEGDRGGDAAEATGGTSAPAPT